MILDSIMETSSIVKTLEYMWAIRSQAPKDIYVYIYGEGSTTNALTSV